MRDRYWVSGVTGKGGSRLVARLLMGCGEPLSGRHGCGVLTAAGNARRGAHHRFAGPRKGPGG
jgi:hypothetical protein